MVELPKVVSRTSGVHGVSSFSVDDRAWTDWPGAWNQLAPMVGGIMTERLLRAAMAEVAA